jgi:hypothetical protein
MEQLDRILLAVWIAAAVTLSAAPATATLISVDDPRFGPGSVTDDTATGLRWLDLTLTDEWSWLEVEAELGEGGSLEGYRHATFAEVMALFQTAGLPAPVVVDRVADPELWARALSLLDLIGRTWPEGLSTYGTVADLDEGGFVVGAIEYFSLTFPDGSTYDRYWIGESFSHFEFPPGGRSTEVGHFLVKPIPEPGTLVLVAMGTAGLAALRRRDLPGGRRAAPPL